MLELSGSITKVSKKLKVLSIGQLKQLWVQCSMWDYLLLKDIRCVATTYCKQSELCEASSKTEHIS